MKKKIAILGSTGSIGKSTIEVIKKNKKNFDVILLTANKNYKKLVQQAKEVNAKNVLIKNKTFYEKVKKGLRNRSTKVYSGDFSIKKITKKKIDCTMAAIVGIAGLQPTLDAIKNSRSVAIANKESIICAWNILFREIKKNKTKIFPVDSEHFSIMELTQNVDDDEVEEIIITASGGPFLNYSKNKLKNVSPAQALLHPNWKMGKKISIDSANLMNKVFEVIEACKLFKFDKKKYKIVIHPQSYVHSIIRFRSGLIKMVLYNSDMKIPISNILNGKKSNIKNVKNIDIEKLNKLSFQKVNFISFPSVKLIEKSSKYGLLTPTIINASNEVLVDLFLSKKIGFLDIVNTINKIFKDKDFRKYARRVPTTIKDIKIADNWARLKTKSICVR
tara:strand:- start:2774 stop:3940 length:1167 start_codon:yes stop_codon:yes gene_type:complete